MRTAVLASGLRLAWRHKVISTVVVVFIAMVIAVSVTTGTGGAASYRAAPAFTLAALGEPGRQVSLSQYEGQPVIVNFWASWCTPCRLEAPLLERAQQRLATRGGTVLGVTYRDASPDSTSFVKRFKINYPSVRDVDGKLAKDYGTRQLPETFVIDGRGRVAAIKRGPVNRAFLDEALAKVGA